MTLLLPYRALREICVIDKNLDVCTLPTFLIFDRYGGLSYLEGPYLNYNVTYHIDDCYRSHIRIAAHNGIIVAA